MQSIHHEPTTHQPSKMWRSKMSLNTSLEIFMPQNTYFAPYCSYRKVIKLNNLPRPIVTNINVTMLGLFFSKTPKKMNNRTL